MLKYFPEKFDLILGLMYLFPIEGILLSFNLFHETLLKKNVVHTETNINIICEWFCICISYFFQQECNIRFFSITTVVSRKSPTQIFRNSLFRK